jgi:hypothetical protein
MVLSFWWLTSLSLPILACEQQQQRANAATTLARVLSRPLQGPGGAPVRMTGFNHSTTETLKVVVFYVSDPGMPFLDLVQAQTP